MGVTGQGVILKNVSPVKFFPPKRTEVIKRLIKSIEFNHIFPESSFLFRDVFLKWLKNLNQIHTQANHRKEAKYLNQTKTIISNHISY